MPSFLFGRLTEGARVAILSNKFYLLDTIVLKSKASKGSNPALQEPKQSVPCSEC